MRPALSITVALSVAFALPALVPTPRLQAQLQPLPAGAQAEADSIDPERLRTHVKTLSSDAFEGGDRVNLAASLPQSTSQTRFVRMACSLRGITARSSSRYRWWG